MLRTGLFLLTMTVVSCHTPESRSIPEKTPPEDTTQSFSATNNHTDQKGDTIALAGNFILFLRPVDADEANPEAEVEDDSDFAVGIVNTDDSISKNKKYKDIHVAISTARYILIKDCKNGPLIIDRDTVSYGVILSGKGKAISTTYNSIHSGDYLGEVNDYFSLE